MRPLSGALIAFGIAAASVLSTPTSLRSQSGPRTGIERIGGHDAAANEILFRPRRTLRTEEQQQLARRLDAALLAAIGRGDVLRARSRSHGVAALIDLLSGDADVEYVEPNYIVRAFAEPDDAMFPQLWGLLNTGQAINGIAGKAGADIHATDAWNISVGSTATVVGIVDTGIDYTHTDLAANIWSAPAAFTVDVGGRPIKCAAGSHGFNAIRGTCDPMDDNLHGTHVAGTIGAAGNNGRGVVGVNWVAQLIGLKFLDRDGSGTVADAVNAIEFAIQTKQIFSATEAGNIRVLSNSWGGPDFSQALLDEVNAANDSDMLFVAAAGNSALDNDLVPGYPASYNAPNVVAVAATTSADARAWFSNYGASSVHLGAPGLDILSTTPNDGYAFESGTSMATPHVSGAAALVLSRCTLDTAALKAALLGTVEPIPSLAGKTITGGRLDVNSAIHSCIAAPAAPVLSAVGGDRQVVLTWSRAVGATSYNVKRSTASGGPYSPVWSGAATSYTDSAVVNDTTYFYVVRAENPLGESADSNEVSATPKTPSDLVIPSMTVPSTSAPDAAIVVTATVKNQGLGAADASTTRFYFSNDTVINAGDTALADALAVPALTAGASFTGSVTLVIPSNAAIGLHFVIGKADSDDALNESQEGNNTLARSVQIGPDLTVSSIIVPSTAAAGATISVSDTTTNKGGQTAGASTTRFYLSVNAIFDSSDALLEGGRAVPELSPGAANSGSTLVTVPANVADGTYYLFARADADNVVVETQEANNTALRSIRLGVDLVVSALAVPSKSAAGLPITVTDTTMNQGAADVAASVTRFYLSANAILDSSDLLLPGGRAVPDLVAGASSSGSTTLTLPTSLATGSYYVVAKADGDNAIAEGSETNNTRLASIQIGGDLIVSALSVPTRAPVAGSVDVSDTVKNQGGGPVSASTTRFYLSAKSVLDSSAVPLAGGRSVSALEPSTSSTGSTTLGMPSGTVAGSYFLIAKTDGDGAVPETQEFNNALARAIALGPDLIASSLSVPASAVAGTAITVTDVTLNQGADAAGVSNTRYYLSTNSLLDASDLLLIESRTVPSLSSGTSSSGSAVVTIPGGTAAGSYFLLAVADGDKAVPESSETNNTTARGLKVTSP